MKRHHRKIYARANALVEFALTAPLFFLMVWGLLDVARLETGQIIFRRHAHELVRHLASLDLPDAGHLEDESRHWSMNHGWVLSDVHVSLFSIPIEQKKFPGRLPEIVERMQVELNAPYSPMSPLMMALHHVSPLHQHAVINEVRVYASSIPS